MGQITLLQHVPAPEVSNQRQAANAALSRLVRKFDPALRDARARVPGEAGEAFLFQAEQNRLKPPLTDHVRLSPTQYRATF